ncbi:hypothetical protein PSPO01_10161 [Paraphaeosphaeria sporulosa]
MSRDSDWFWSVEHQDYYKAVYNADGSLVRYVWARETTNPTPQVTTQEIESAWAWSQDHRDWYKAVYDADGSVARYTWGRDSTAPTTQSAPQYSSPTPTSGSAQYSSPPPTYTPDAPRPEHPSRSYSAPANTSQALISTIGFHRTCSEGYEFSRFKQRQSQNDPGHADVILGHSYLKEKGILQDFNLSNLYPLLSYGGPSQSEMTSQQSAEDQRRREQAALEQRRQAQATSTSNLGTKPP